MAIHQDLTKLTQAQLIEMLVAQQAAATRKLSFKVSEKGCVSVYGLVQRGVHLYPEHMLRLLDASDLIRDFIKTNEASLSFKNKPALAA